MLQYGADACLPGVVPPSCSGLWNSCLDRGVQVLVWRHGWLYCGLGQTESFLVGRRYCSKDCLPFIMRQHEVGCLGLSYRAVEVDAAGIAVVLKDPALLSGDMVPQCL